MTTGPDVLRDRLDSDIIKVIGLGGIGALLAQALIQFLASLGARCPVWLVDGDSYQDSNRDRVVFHSYQNKAIAKAAELGELARGAVAILPVPRFVTPRNAAGLIGERDIVFLCVDNHRSRLTVANRCRRLRDTLVVSGGNDGIEHGRAGTFGNVMIYRREGGRELTHAFTRFHPEIARPADKAPYELSCAELAQASAPQLLFTNLQVAAAMLGAFYAWLVGSLNHEEIFVDIAAGRMTPVRRVVSPAR